MTDTVIVALPRFIPQAERIATFLRADVREYAPEIFAEIFPTTRRIVAVMSMGIVMRKIAPLLIDKWTDPAVVVVSPDLAYAIPLVGGHHGANALAQELAALDILPVITTATETFGRPSVESIAAQHQCDIMNRDSTRQVNAAFLDGDVPVYTINGPAVVIAGQAVSVLMDAGKYVIGIGCRKDVTGAEVITAIQSACADADIDIADVQCYATTIQKQNEQGLRDAIAALSARLIFLRDDIMNAQAIITPSKAGKIGLLGVAEPAALALAKEKKLVMTKKVYGRVTVAIAR
ncbi:MAG: cobalt-precorrin 5A hydrolase [Methanoregula sp.]|jgi:cobalt-precorrin 5A hydrolase